MSKATVFFIPQSETPLIIIKPHWGADNGYETATFPTKDEAIAFACKRWGVKVEQIRIEGEANG